MFIESKGVYTLLYSTPHTNIFLQKYPEKYLDGRKGLVNFAMFKNKIRGRVEALPHVGRAFFMLVLLYGIKYRRIVPLHTL